MYAARPKRSFMPRPASLIIRASNPAPAITAKCSPFTEPVAKALAAGDPGGLAVPLENP